RRSFATGELDAILEPSPERVVPGCEYVPRCGGCQYQHASYALQLQMKLDILKETLARAHVPVPAEIGSLIGPPWGYRNRIRLQVMKRAGIALGYRRRGSHALVPSLRPCVMKWNSLPTANRTSCWSLSGREPARSANRRDSASRLSK